MKLQMCYLNIQPNISHKILEVGVRVPHFRKNAPGRVGTQRCRRTRSQPTCRRRIKRSIDG